MSFLQEVVARARGTERVVRLRSPLPFEDGARPGPAGADRLRAEDWEPRTRPAVRTPVATTPDEGLGVQALDGERGDGRRDVRLPGRSGAGAGAEAGRPPPGSTVREPAGAAPITEGPLGRGLRSGERTDQGNVPGTARVGDLADPSGREADDVPNDLPAMGARAGVPTVKASDGAAGTRIGGVPGGEAGVAVTAVPLPVRSVRDGRRVGRGNGSPAGRPGDGEPAGDDSHDERPGDDGHLRDDERRADDDRPRGDERAGNDEDPGDDERRGHEVPDGSVPPRRAQARSASEPVSDLVRAQVVRALLARGVVDPGERLEVHVGGAAPVPHRRVSPSGARSTAVSTTPASTVTSDGAVVVHIDRIDVVRPTPAAPAAPAAAPRRPRVEHDSYLAQRRRRGGP
ncbi:hypothetical protein [Georgenia subflava]|uniref:Uncharacterized protein n=1 Tax=Georgenia subflava TaxID=1622177 RepID=A0A6N7EGP8_9MICO|nr:hypothetical protein [Georgenia subflava]MPV37309.1 hypothetical protein [Georgenia subflava]